MKKKLYNTYSVGDDLTLFELDRITVKNVDYVLLLQKQEPNIVCIGFFDNGKLEIVSNPIVSRELFKIFMKDEKAFKEKFEPFLIKK